MKLDNSGMETMSSNNNNNLNKRDKSVDIKEAKERLKQEKLQKEREKKEREKQEKERKEREKKEKKEREKLMKKGGGQSSASPGPANLSISGPMAVTPSMTTPALNKLVKQGSTSSGDPASNSNMPSSKSENVLSKLRKQSSNNEKMNQSQQQQQQQQQAPLIGKGRYRCQVVYLDETVKTFDIDVK